MVSTTSIWYSGRIIPVSIDNTQEGTSSEDGYLGASWNTDGLLGDVSHDDSDSTALVDLCYGVRDLQALDITNAMMIRSHEAFCAHGDRLIIMGLNMAKDVDGGPDGNLVLAIGNDVRRVGLKSERMRTVAHPLVMIEDVVGGMAFGLGPGMGLEEIDAQQKEVGEVRDY